MGFTFKPNKQVMTNPFIGGCDPYFAGAVKGTWVHRPQGVHLVFKELEVSTHSDSQPARAKR